MTNKDKTHYYVSYYVDTEYGSGFGSIKITSDVALSMDFMTGAKDAIKKDIIENSRVLGLKNIIILNVIKLEE